MSTFQQTGPRAHRAPTDLTAWAVVALVVAVACAVLGWAIARQSTPSRDDLDRSAQMAARAGAINGERTGYSTGAAAGRRDAGLRTKLQVAQARQAASREGYDAGFGAGRARAAARAGDPDAGFYGPTTPTDAAYPSAGYEDLLASGWGGTPIADEPGYSTSAYAGYGYGSGALLPSQSGVYSAGIAGDETGFGDALGF